MWSSKIQKGACSETCQACCSTNWATCSTAMNERNTALVKTNLSYLQDINDTEIQHNLLLLPRRRRLLSGSSHHCRTADRLPARRLQRDTQQTRTQSPTP
jgi:hypothetical protein